MSIFLKANKFMIMAASKNPDPTPKKTSETKVEFSMGQEIRTREGAGSNPSDATMTA
jgi:hypothetical protein